LARAYIVFPCPELSVPAPDPKVKVSWGLSQDSVGALFVQERKNLPRPMHDAPEIGVDLALEFIRGHFFKRR
jgi:hypothetical protein